MQTQNIMQTCKILFASASIAFPAVLFPFPSQNVYIWKFQKCIV